MWSFLSSPVQISNSYFTANGDIVGPLVSANDLVFSKPLTPGYKNLLDTLMIESKDAGKDGTIDYINAWNSQGYPYIIINGISESYDENLKIVLDLQSASSRILLIKILIKVFGMLISQDIKLKRIEDKIDKLK